MQMANKFMESCSNSPVTWEMQIKGYLVFCSQKWQKGEILILSSVGMWRYGENKQISTKGYEL